MMWALSREPSMYVYSFKTAKLTFLALNILILPFFDMTGEQWVLIISLNLVKCHYHYLFMFIWRISNNMTCLTLHKILMKLETLRLSGFMTQKLSSFISFSNKYRTHFILQYSFRSGIITCKFKLPENFCCIQALKQYCLRLGLNKVVKGLRKGYNQLTACYIAFSTAPSTC